MTETQTQPSNEPDRLIARGETMLRAGRFGEARQAFAHATQSAPDSPAAWRGLGNALHRSGRKAEGAKAHLRALQTSKNDPVLVRAAKAVELGRMTEAYSILQNRLQAEQDDIVALRLMATIAAKLGKPDHAVRMLSRVVELAPEFAEAFEQLRIILYAMPIEAALAAIDVQLEKEAQHLGYLSLKADVYEKAGEHEQGISLRRGIVEAAPYHSGSWTSLGHVLETVGCREESVAAFRQALVIDSANGDAWWSLANIKTHRFSADDVQAMHDLFARDDLPSEEHMLIGFALGKALEDAGDHEASFAHYAEGNRLKRKASPYNHPFLTDQIGRSRRVFTPAFFAEREGAGDPSPDPIFIVGMPRAGSTLVEQILGSHPAVEATAELSDLTRTVLRIDAPGGRYPDAITQQSAQALAAFGRDYLETTRIQRKTAKPRFIDKAPTNFRRVGLIQTILPNAKIIDIRRHPLACGFSCFRQHFAMGFTFTNDLEDLGRYYRAYVEMMADWDAVLPGRVHRIHYEQLITDTEGEVRRLLDYLDLPFDDACLRFHQSARPVSTPSASQVRQPIYRDALEAWRAYEPWLGPLKDALGDVLDNYPFVPSD